MDELGRNGSQLEKNLPNFSLCFRFQNMVEHTMSCFFKEACRFSSLGVIELFLSYLKLLYCFTVFTNTGHLHDTSLLRIAVVS